LLSIIQFFSPGKGPRDFFRRGRKTIQPDAGQQIIPGAHFYASVSGNYVDIFNYRDELCARFLLGSSRLD